MSDALTPETPETDAAVETPAADEAVNDGSVDSTEVIPKERFNGLMSTYQSEKRAWEVERDAMRTELERLEDQAGGNENVDEAVLAQTVEAIVSQRLADERAADASRKAALDKYPDAAVFADLIVGDSPEAFENMARVLSERVQSFKPAVAGDETTEETTETNTTVVDADGRVRAPQTSGSNTVDDHGTVDEAMAEAIVNKDFPALMRAAEERSRLQQGADLTVG